MKKCRKVVCTIVLILLGAAGGIAGSLAYLHAVTQTKVNVFASDKKISIALRERAWDGYDFNDKDTQNGQGIKPGLPDETVAELGFVQAHNYVPGQRIPKDPSVKNTGENEQGVTLHAAIRVQYYDGNGRALSYQSFKEAYLSAAGIDFGMDWTKISTNDPEEVYIYNVELAAGEESTPLFTQIPISEDLTAGPDGKLPSFSVHVTAYAIQAENMAGDTAGIEQIMYDFVTSKK